MTLVYIPTLINWAVAILIIFLTIVVAYDALIKERKAMDMGEEETKAQLFVERRIPFSEEVQNGIVVGFNVKQ